MLSVAPLVVIITAALNKRAKERTIATADPTIRRWDEFPIRWSLSMIGIVIAILIGGLLLLAEATTR
jgi:hypothetical protein